MSFPSFLIKVAPGEKIFTRLAASFLVIVDAAVINSSNNLTVSDSGIVFALLGRFGRFCKIKQL